jgi:hypothetical protein
MDKSEYIQRRRKRYLAQTLDHFEQKIEPHVPRTQMNEINDFKALVRAKFNALAIDAVEIGEVAGVNGLAIEQRDRLAS